MHVVSMQRCALTVAGPAAVPTPTGTASKRRRACSRNCNTNNIPSRPYFPAVVQGCDQTLQIDVCSASTISMVGESTAEDLGLDIVVDEYDFDYDGDHRGYFVSAEVPPVSQSSIVGISCFYLIHNGCKLFFDGFVVIDEDMDKFSGDVVVGTPFMECNDVLIRPSKRMILFGDYDVSYSYGFNTSKCDPALSVSRTVPDCVLDYEYEHDAVRVTSHRVSVADSVDSVSAIISPRCTVTVDGEVIGGDEYGSYGETNSDLVLYESEGVKIEHYMNIDPVLRKNESDDNDLTHYMSPDSVLFESTVESGKDVTGSSGFSDPVEVHVGCIQLDLTSEFHEDQKDHVCYDVDHPVDLSCKENGTRVFCDSGSNIEVGNHDICGMHVFPVPSIALGSPGSITSGTEHSSGINKCIDLDGTFMCSPGLDKSVVHPDSQHPIAGRFCSDEGAVCSERVANSNIVNSIVSESFLRNNSICSAAMTDLCGNYSTRHDLFDRVISSTPSSRSGCSCDGHPMSAFRAKHHMNGPVGKRVLYSPSPYHSTPTDLCGDYIISHHCIQHPVRRRPSHHLILDVQAMLTDGNFDPLDISLTEPLAFDVVTCCPDLSSPWDSVNSPGLNIQTYAYSVPPLTDHLLLHGTSGNYDLTITYHNTECLPLDIGSEDHHSCLTGAPCTWTLGPRPPSSSVVLSRERSLYALNWISVTGPAFVVPAPTLVITDLASMDIFRPYVCLDSPP